MASKFEIEVGDCLPDFRLVDRQRHVMGLLSLARGRPLVALLLGGDGALEAPETLRALAEAGAGLAAARGLLAALPREEARERGVFAAHRDNVDPRGGRRFAMSLNLNTGAYEGGQLRFPEYGPHLYRPDGGAALVFSSLLVHEAMPVTAGRRFVLLTFFRA